jgi:hypothetical protein
LQCVVFSFICARKSSTELANHRSRSPCLGTEFKWKFLVAFV